jgi:hypothetical protein
MDLPHNKEKQQQADEDANNTLSKEIRAWKAFEYALKEDNRLLFNRMLSECGENEDYVRAASSRDEYFSAKSLFIENQQTKTFAKEEAAAATATATTTTNIYQKIKWSQGKI